MYALSIFKPIYFKHIFVDCSALFCSVRGFFRCSARSQRRGPVRGSAAARGSVAAVLRRHGLSPWAALLLRRLSAAPWEAVSFCIGGHVRTPAAPVPRSAPARAGLRSTPASPLRAALGRSSVRHGFRVVRAAVALPSLAAAPPLGPLLRSLASTGTPCRPTRLGFRACLPGGRRPRLAASRLRLSAPADRSPSPFCCSPSPAAGRARRLA